MDNENKDIKIEETPIGIKPLEGDSNNVTTLPTNDEVKTPEVTSDNISSDYNSFPTDEVKLVKTQNIPVQNEAPVKEEIVLETGIVNNPEPNRNEKKKMSIADIIMYIIMVVIIIVIILLLLKFCEGGKNDGKGIVTTTTTTKSVTTTTTTVPIVTNSTTTTTTMPIVTQTTTGTTTKKVTNNTTTTTRPTTTKKSTTTTKKTTTKTTTTTKKTTTTTKKANEYTYTYVVQTSETFAVTFYNNGKKITEDITVLVDGFPVASGKSLITIDIDDINVGNKPKITFIYDNDPSKTCTAVYE